MPIFCHPFFRPRNFCGFGITSNVLMISKKRDDYVDKSDRVFPWDALPPPRCAKNMTTYLLLVRLIAIEYDIMTS